MAKGWRSTTKIQHGKADGEVVIFEIGDLVEGLDTKEMAQLWEAGALVEVEVPVSGTAGDTSATTPTSPTAAAPTNEASSAEGTPTT